MKKIVILSEKSWHKILPVNLKKIFPDYEWILISKKDSFTLSNLKSLGPRKIFIPHWSYIIPEEIYTRFECIVFHMTDLPFGRGGSPLQNLIAKGYRNTKISAIKVEKGIDTGPVYLKKNLDLYGTAQEIFLRSTSVIKEMITKILKEDVKPLPQNGKPVIFKRRKPEEGNLQNIGSIEEFYDFIRMLDCDSYPNAFLENQNFRFEFSRATMKSDKEIIADVRIIKK